MVYIAYYTELNSKIWDCAQKRRICRENCKYALDERFHGHFYPRRKPAKSCHPDTNTVSTKVYFKVAALRCSSLPKLMVNKRMSHIKQTFVWWYGFTAVQIKILYQHIYWEWRFKSVFELKKLSSLRSPMWRALPFWCFRHSVPLPLVWSTLLTPHIFLQFFPQIMVIYVLKRILGNLSKTF